MPCAAGDLCQLPNEELIAPNGHECGHECRGGCGGRLHGLCGEVEDGSVRAGAAIKEGGVQDSELCEVLTQLEIVPGRPVPPAAVVAAQSWATLEDQEDIAEALAADAKDALTERMAGIVAEEIDPSDDEKELNESGDAESGGGRKVEAPPPYSDLSSCFGPLEQKAESAGNSEAAHFLRKAKMAFLAAHAAKPTRQADIRMFSES